jgi:hypothetical protein
MLRLQMFVQVWIDGICWDVVVKSGLAVDKKFRPITSKLWRCLGVVGMSWPVHERLSISHPWNTVVPAVLQSRKVAFHVG